MSSASKRCTIVTPETMRIKSIDVNKLQIALIMRIQIGSQREDIEVQIKYRKGSQMLFQNLIWLSMSASAQIFLFQIV